MKHPILLLCSLSSWLVSTYYVPGILEATDYVVWQVPEGTGLIWSSKSQSVLRKQSLTVFNGGMCGGGGGYSTWSKIGPCQTIAQVFFRKEKERERETLLSTWGTVFFLLDDILEGSISRYTTI